MKKSMTRQVREAKERIKKLEQEMDEIKKDREIFRQEFVQLVKIGLANDAVPRAFLVEKLAKIMNRVKPFYWTGY